MALVPNPEKPWRRGFWAFVAAQFQSAVSDNAFKFLLIFLITTGGLAREKRDFLVPVVAALFALPFILFSMAGGYLADRYSKRTVALGTKGAECLVTVLAAASLTSGSLPLQLAAMFLLSTAAALFSPSKYGVIPEILPPSLLSWGNGFVSLGTFLATIVGTLGGAWMATQFIGRPWLPGAVLVGSSVLGLGATLGLPRVPAADPEKPLRLNPIADLLAQLREIQSRPRSDAGRRRNHLLLLSRGAPAARDRRVRHRRAAY